LLAQWWLTLSLSWMWNRLGGIFFTRRFDSCFISIVEGLDNQI
jgi:hypothetical protein